MQDSDQWHYLEAGSSVGPFSQGDLVPLVKSGVFSASTRVWNPSLEGWKPAGDTELAVLFAPPSGESQEKSPTTEQASLSQDHYISSAMRGLLAATISSAITIGEVIPTLAHGVVFSAVVFPYFHRLGIINPQRIFGLVVLIAVAYTTAFMVSYEAWMDAYKANRSAPTDVLAGPGFISGMIGYAIPICMFLFLKMKPQVGFLSYLGFALPFGVYSAITMPLAASIERPTGEPMFYPTEFVTSMIVHAPWQAAFAVVLAFLLGKSEFRRPSHLLDT